MPHDQSSEPDYGIVPAGRDCRLLQETLSLRNKSVSSRACRNADALTASLTVDTVKPYGFFVHMGMLKLK
jgi:hypothetical protein